MVDLEKLDKILKVILLCLLVVLLIVMRVYKLDSCDLIQDKTNGLSQAEVVQLYHEKCLKEYRVELDNPLLKGSMNLTLIKP